MLTFVHSQALEDLKFIDLSGSSTENNDDVIEYLKLHPLSCS